VGKNPAFQFYSGDWLKDPELQACNASTRGIWINLIAHMWESNPRGEIRGTLLQITRLGNTNSKQMSLFINEVGVTHFADVENTNGIYIIRNRRMIREEKEREATRERVQKHRAVTDLKQECNGNVTPPSSSSTSSSSSKDIYTSDFESFWKLYPRKIEKTKAFKCWQKLMKDGVKPTHLKVCADNYAGVCEALETEMQFIKYPATFLGPNKLYEDYKVSVPVEVDELIKTDPAGNPFAPIVTPGGKPEWVTGKEFDELRGAGKVTYLEGKWTRVKGES